jgi:hypothetical protein
MDNQTLVDEQKNEGDQFLQRLREVKFEVAVGFWALTTDEERWFLYIASPEIDRQGLAAAFSLVNIELGRLDSHWIQRSDIRLISSTDPIAVEAINYGRDRFPTNFGGRKLGSLIIERAYIYPMASVSIQNASP